MPNLTQLITRQTGFVAWYPLTNDFFDASTITDESGNARHMDTIPPGIDRPTLTLNQLNGEKAVVHDDDASIMQYVGSVSVRDIFMVAKVDDVTTFSGSYRGMLSGLVSASGVPALFVGVGGTNRWVSIAEGAPAQMGYLVDDVLYADGARTAPFTTFRRLRLSTSGAAVAMDGIQVGRDREFGARLFKGKWADLMLFSTQRTVDEALAIGLYHDLKFNLWRTNGTTLNFPIPGMTGISYRHFYEMPQKWDDTVVSHEYEDGGRSFNEKSAVAVKEWQIEFDCVAQTHALAKSQYEIFDEFWNAVRTNRSFNFKDKYGVTHTGVRIKDYSRSHSQHRSWKNDVVFKLWKLP